MCAKVLLVFWTVGGIVPLLSFYVRHLKQFSAHSRHALPVVTAHRRSVGDDNKVTSFSQCHLGKWIEWSQVLSYVCLVSTACTFLFLQA
jgi:hypothetical protein